MPTQVERDYTTRNDNQKSVKFPVFQGERALTTDKDMHCLGNVSLTGLKPQPKGVPKFLVTFCIDADGILTVTAKDKKTGKHTPFKELHNASYKPCMQVNLYLGGQLNRSTA